MADVIFPGATPAGKIGADQLPQNLDLELWKGDYLEFFTDFTDNTLQKNPINLAGYTPLAVMKSSFNSATTYTFTTEIQVGSGGASNRIRVYLPSSISKTIPAGDYIWNLQLTAPNGDVRTRLAGDVTVHAEVDA